MTIALYDVPLEQIDGVHTSLRRYQGKVLLIVNVASKCGLTPQYAGLEKLYQDRYPRGFEVLGFPANDFRGQEPGSNAAIREFCSTSYDVHFPLFAKISVRGAEQHPLYRQLIAAQPAALGGASVRKRLQAHGMEPGDATEVLWNFEKFLVGRSGEVVGRFAPDIAPEDPRLQAAIDAELEKA